jgi:hypothetical protein
MSLEDIKPDTERQISHDLVCMQNLKEVKWIDVGSKMVLKRKG